MAGRRQTSVLIALTTTLLALAQARDARAQTAIAPPAATARVEFRAVGDSIPIDEPVATSLRATPRALRRHQSVFRCWTPCTLELRPGTAHLLVADRAVTVPVPPTGASYLVPAIPRARSRLAVGAIVSGTTSFLLGLALVMQSSDAEVDALGWAMAGSGLVAGLVGAIVYEIESRRPAPLLDATATQPSVTIGEPREE